MAIKTVQDSSLTSVANAIRQKGGTSAPLELWINGANISANSITVGYAVTDEYTNANKYELHFHCTFGRNPIRPQDGANSNNGFFIGVDPTEDTSYFVNNYCKGRSGVYVNCSQILEYKNGYPINTVFISKVNDADFKVARDGDDWHIYRNDELIYSATNLPKNTLGFYCEYYPTLSNVSLYYEPVAEITPSVDDYDGSMYGSNLHLEVRDDHLNLIDYGMLPSGAVGSGKIIVNDVPIKADNLELELETKYNNTRFQRLNNLTGEMQMRVYEDISTSDSVKEYSQVLCSPMVVPNVQTVFTRHSEEGILYYIKDPKMTENTKTNPSYLCNAYNQYKGGCEIKTETGIQLFDLDNAHSPVYVDNNLVRAEFHRRSGYIRLARWDENSSDWYEVNVLKIQNNPQLKLVEYNDDYAEVQFGSTVWKFYRGRPFIVCNHPNDDLRILKLVDRVYCETSENERGLGFIQETNPNQRIKATDESGKELDNYSTFDPQLSVQQFKQELHIGQNIRTDNFELYDIDGNYNLQDPNDDSSMAVIPVETENALLVQKQSGSKLALCFPSHSSYVKRVDSTFSLLIQYVDTDISSFKVKARGFDERGAVPVKDNIQYGIWEQTVDVTVDTTETDEIRVTFTNCPTDVKYLDFVLIFDTTSTSETILKKFMYYQGDSIINYDIDNSKAYAEKVEIFFSETYFANIFNDLDPFGLCIIRPSQHKFSLVNIYADTETVFAPYMKKCKEWDKPSQVFLEYLNSNRQVIDIDWEN